MSPARTFRQDLSPWYFFAALTLLFGFQYFVSTEPAQTISYSQFKSLLRRGQISEVVLREKEVGGSIKPEALSDILSPNQVAALGERAKKVLHELGYENIELKIGDGFFGWEERGPFDAILMTAAAPKIPEPLWNQLREGGRLVMPLGEERKSQKLIRATKSAGRPVTEDFTDVLFVPLRGAIQKPCR